MPSLPEFLRAILPDEGLKCATVIIEGSARNYFFATIKEQAEFILTQDALGRGAVYHACATYKTSDNRRQDNALAAKAFWLDIDAGEGKPYADARSSAEAVLGFCSTLGLPVPLFVGSGAGLHCYWPLAGSLDPATWRSYASGLKALCREHGLQAGPERTADIASILRPPGSHWRKREPHQLVQVGELVGPYGLERFGALAAGGGAKHSPPAAGALPRRLAGLNARAAVTHDLGDADVVASSCAQVARMRDTGGRLPEPHWYAVLGVLAFCHGGEALAHEWSKGDERYTPEDTARKFQRAGALSGPPTCAHFHDTIDAATCRTCPLFGKITTPLYARPLPQERAAPPPVEVPGLEPITRDKLPPVPFPFGWNEQCALVLQAENKNGENGDVTVSEFPIYLERVQTGEIQGEKFSYRFQQWLPRKGWRPITIDARELMGQSGIAAMFEKGANIAERDLFKRFVIVSANQFHRESDLSLRYDQFGWKEDASFLCGANLYTPNGVVPATGSDEVRTRAQWLGPRAGGSLERWSAAANRLFAHGCEAQSFALLAAFAAPLMRFHATDEGGAIISLTSRRSGTGKTTAIAAAASVWGRMAGMRIKNTDTPIAKAISLGALGNLPALYDELAERDPEVVKEFVLTFTNGSDKLRGATDGTIRHLKATWQTLLITGSNLPLVDLLQATGTDAASFRVLEFQATLPKGMDHTLGDKLRRDLDMNAGHAGHAYLSYIVQPAVRAWIESSMLQIAQDIWVKTGFRSEHRFWVRAIASVAVAGAIVQKLGLLDFSPQRIVNWALETSQMNKNDAPVTGEVEDKQASISSLAAFMDDHVGSTLVVNRGYGPKNAPPLLRPFHKLVIRYERDNARILVNETILKGWLLKRQVSFREMINDLVEAGVVITKRRMITLSAGTDLPGGQVPCVEISGRHPALSGFLAPVEEFVKQAEERRA